MEYKGICLKINRLVNSKFAKALFLGCFPFLCTFIYLMLHGKRYADVSLFASNWNDELFYYKQVDAIVNYGYPRGYFGFNESHALNLSFAAWSPVLVWPWVLWGMLFGWNINSPIICNLVLLMFSMFIFAVLACPSWWQTIIIALCYSTFFFATRYIFSGMPEVIIWSMLVVFYGLAVSYEKSPEKKGRGTLIYLLLFTGFIMTLMRPYLVLFMLLPLFYIIRDNRGLERVLGLFIDIALLAVTLFVYYLINHYLAAEYFAPLFFTDWIDVFTTDGLWIGVLETVKTIYLQLVVFKNYMINGWTWGTAAGNIFSAYVIVLCIILAFLGVKIIKDKKIKSFLEKRMLLLHLLIAYMGMLIALLLMYKFTEGSKHLITFIFVAMFVITVSCEDKKLWNVISGMIFSCAMLVLFVYKGLDDYDYEIPFVQQDEYDNAKYWEKVFEENMLLNEKELSYNNVVIWVLSDKKSEAADWSYTNWNMLYQIPSGYGVSCCTNEYVMDNLRLDNINSKYLFTVSSGNVSNMCLQLDNWIKIDEYKGNVLYMQKK